MKSKEAFFILNQILRAAHPDMPPDDILRFSHDSDERYVLFGCRLIFNGERLYHMTPDTVKDVINESVDNLEKEMNEYFTRIRTVVRGA